MERIPARTTLATIPQFWIGVGLALLGALDYAAPAIVEVFTQGATIPPRLNALPVTTIGPCGGIILITLGFALTAAGFEKTLNSSR